MEEIVCLGAGAGLRHALAGLAERPVRLTALVGVVRESDAGSPGHSGAPLPDPRDAAEALVALAPAGILKKIFDHRPPDAGPPGLRLGARILEALTRIEGDLGLAVERAAALLQVRGSVLPVTLRGVRLCAELATGWKITGTREILERAPRVRILKMHLDPCAPLYPPCARAIARASLIVLCPGPLFTGTLAALLTKGLREAMRESPARVAFVCNLLTHPGETDGFTARDHVRTLEGYLRFHLDHILVNRVKAPPEILSHLASIGSELVEDDLDEDLRAVRGDFLQEASLEALRLHDGPGPLLVRHDTASLTAAILALLD